MEAGNQGKIATQTEISSSQKFLGVQGQISGTTSSRQGSENMGMRCRKVTRDGEKQDGGVCGVAGRNGGLVSQKGKVFGMRDLDEAGGKEEREFRECKEALRRRTGPGPEREQGDESWERSAMSHGWSQTRGFTSREDRQGR